MTKAEIIRSLQELARSGQAAVAIERLAPLLQSHPDDPDFNQQMALLVLSRGATADAAQYFARSVQLAPASVEYRSNYATVLSMTGRHAEAAAEYRRAIAVRPESYPAQIGLSTALLALSEYDAALSAARQANFLDAARPEPWLNMSIALMRSGRAEEGLKVVERGLQRFPNHPVLLMHMVANLHYTPGIGPQRIRDEHERLGRLVAMSLPPPHAFSNTRDPERPLRIGYLSPDFRDHSVAHFLRPILAAHDPAQARVYCYSAVLRPDAATEEFKAAAPTWREVATLDDAALESVVRGDQIDILVDLAGHTGGGRVMSMARRLAPVQATYLGYPNTTGIPAIDYRLVDSHTDPAGAESLSTEKLVRLDPCFLCYRGSREAPGFSPSPAARDGFVTFGSFNAAQKVSAPVIESWARITGSVPASRLVLKTSAFDAEPVRRDFLRRFAAAGLGPDRVELLGRTADPIEHLKTYSRIDVALDTFPYNGATTTCEALWMGVPVVTLAGASHAGRVGASILTAAGAAELVAPDLDAYVTRAVSLANDTARLEEYRINLRAQLQSSPLCDADGFTRRLERAYRDMWRAYCESPKA
jgi:predicted O-linked N-acetylglucosamine transferase (SPINDLY family)